MLLTSRPIKKLNISIVRVISLYCNLLQEQNANNSVWNDLNITFLLTCKKNWHAQNQHIHNGEGYINRQDIYKINNSPNVTQTTIKGEQMEDWQSLQCINSRLQYKIKSSKSVTEHVKYTYKIHQLKTRASECHLLCHLSCVVSILGSNQSFPEKNPIRTVL